MFHGPFHRVSLHTALSYAVLALHAIFALHALPADLTMASGFPDLPSSRAGADAVSVLASQGIAHGFPDGTFRPDGTLTRAEFVTIAVRALFASGEGEECLRTHDAGVSFGDVAQGSWFAGALCVAVREGWVRGYPDGTFRPGDPVDLSAAGQILAAGYRVPVTAQPDAPWYRAPLEALSARGALPPTVYRPDRALTRLEMAEMVYRLSADVRDRPSADAAVLLHGAAPALDPEVQVLLSLVNEERAKAGAQPLRVHAALQRMAEDMVADLSKKGRLDHVSVAGLKTEDRVRASGYLDVDRASCGCRSWTYRYGENAVRAASAREAASLWMGSKIHRDNILNPVFEDAGLARHVDTWVLDFGAIIER